MKDKEAVWSADKLKAFAEKTITAMFGSILDFAQTAVDSDYRFTVLRSKILREGNEAIRSIKREVDRNYEVKYTKVSEDVVKVKQPLKGKGK